MIELLAAGLPSCGIQAEVVCLRGDGPFPARLSSRGIPTTVFDLRTHPGSFIALIRFLRSRKPDILQSFLFAGNLIGRIAGVLSGVSIRVAGQRSTDPWRRLWHWMAERLTSPLVTAWVSNSHAGREVLVARAGIPEHRIAVIPNGIPPMPVPEPREHPGPVVGTVGNLRPAKGHEVLLSAAVRVRRRFPACRFVILGSGPLRDNLLCQAELLGLSDAVELPGFAPDPLREMASFDVFVLPSLWEGCPVSLLEAMMLQRACVASAVGDIPRIITHGENGLLVPARDPRALADATVSLLADSALRTRLGIAARETVLRRYSASEMLRSYARLYLSLAGGSPCARDVYTRAG